MGKPRIESPWPPATAPGFYRDAVNLSRDMVVLLDAEGTIVYESPAVIDVLGHQPEEMVGRPVFDFVHPDDLSLTAQTIRQVIAGDAGAGRLEIRLRCRDGRWRVMECVGNRWDSDGRPYVLVNSRDITDRQRALWELARSNELLTKTQQSSRNIVSLTRAATGEYIEVNDEWLRVAGYTRDEVVGRTALELGLWGTPENRNRVMRAIRDGGGRLRDYEATTYPPSGPKQFIINVETIAFDGEQLILMTGTDVTESRITEEKLRHAQKMEAVGQLTGGVAHDFNNLLGVILGNAEILQEAVADEPQAASLVSSILQASERGATLTRQLLAFSRRQVLAPRSVRLDEVVTRMMPLLTATLGPAVQVSVDAPENLWPCMVDPAELENAVLNLVINSRDAMLQGGRLRIEMANRVVADSASLTPADPARGDYASLAVVDEGQGMDAVTVSKAFDPFFTTKEVGRGTGLGLSMVFGFVRQSGGQVSIESELGVGTRVTLLLPRVTIEIADEEEAGTTELALAQGETVLVLEDEPAMLKLVKSFLTRLGYAVLEARDEVALENLLDAGASFDLLLSDVLLSGARRGPEVAETVLARRPGTAVLYMSGYPMRQLDEHLLPSVTGRLLAKPFTCADLARWVRESLDR